MLSGLIMLLAACQSNAVLQLRNWENHRFLVENQSSWTLQGRLNIREQNNSNTVAIHWQQFENSFEINLNGTLGLAATTISGNSKGVSLQRANEETVWADSLRDFTRDFMAFEFPAEVLYYWIRGIPAPGSTADIELNEQELLQVLRQSDSLGRLWQLKYDRYQSAEGLSLPGRIHMSQADYELTLLIQYWQLDAEDA